MIEATIVFVVTFVVLVILLVMIRHEDDRQIAKERRENVWLHRALRDARGEASLWQQMYADLRGDLYRLERSQESSEDIVNYWLSGGYLDIRNPNNREGNKRKRERIE